jgi:hypothetical protein
LFILVEKYNLDINENTGSKDEVNISDEFLAQLNKFLSSHKHKYKTNQTKVCKFVVERIYNRVMRGYGSKHFGAINIDKKENLIVDGNHRYIAYEMANIEYEIRSYTKSHCDKYPYKEIKDIEIDSIDDWDAYNAETIKYLTDDFLDKL